MWAKRRGGKRCKRDTMAQARGEITRVERPHRGDAAQPVQDLIDRILCAHVVTDVMIGSAAFHPRRAGMQKDPGRLPP